MTTFTQATKQLVEKIGHPLGASDKLLIEKIEILSSRLIELAIKYEHGSDVLNDAKLGNESEVNKRALNFISELIDVMPIEHPVTLNPIIDRFHLTPEFLKLLQLATEIHAREVFKISDLNKAISLISRSRAGSDSPNRNDLDQLPIIEAANSLFKKNPSMSTSSIAEVLHKKFPNTSAGRIRNILSPLKIFYDSESNNPEK